MKRVVKSENDKDVQEVLLECENAENNGSSKFPNMNYEHGVCAGIRWVLGLDINNPLSE